MYAWGNKLASLGATLVRNYDWLTYLLTGVKCRATSVAKNSFFFTFSERGGGGLVESKISLTEKTEIFLDFLAERGGGSHPIQKGFSRKLGKISKKSHFFWIFCRKLGFFWTFFRNGGGGVWLNPKFSLTENFWVSKLMGGGGSRLFGQC